MGRDGSSERSEAFKPGRVARQVPRYDPAEPNVAAGAGGPETSLERRPKVLVGVDITALWAPAIQGAIDDDATSFSADAGGRDPRAWSGPGGRSAGPICRRLPASMERGQRLKRKGKQRDRDSTATASGLDAWPSHVDGIELVWHRAQSASTPKSLLPFGCSLGRMRCADRALRLDRREPLSSHGGRSTVRRVAR